MSSKKQCMSCLKIKDISRSAAFNDSEIFLCYECDSIGLRITECLKTPLKLFGLSVILMIFYFWYKAVFPSTHMTSKEVLSLWYISTMINWIFITILTLEMFLPSLEKVNNKYSCYSNAKIKLHGICYICGEPIEDNNFVIEEFYMDDSSYDSKKNSSFCRSKHKICPSIGIFNKIVCSFRNISGNLAWITFSVFFVVGIQYLAFREYGMSENSIEYQITAYSVIYFLPVFCILLIHVMISNDYEGEIYSYLKKNQNPNFTLSDVMAFSMVQKEQKTRKLSKYLLVIFLFVLLLIVAAIFIRYRFDYNLNKENIILFCIIAPIISFSIILIPISLSNFETIFGKIMTPIIGGILLIPSPYYFLYSSEKLLEHEFIDGLLKCNTLHQKIMNIGTGTLASLFWVLLPFLAIIIISLFVIHVFFSNTYRMGGYIYEKRDKESLEIKQKGDDLLGIILLGFFLLAIVQVATTMVTTILFSIIVIKF